MYVCVSQCVTKNVFRGMVTMVRALIAGLEHTYHSRGPGGMASTMMILEIMHTHFWEKEGSSKSDTSNQSLVAASLFCYNYNYNYNNITTTSKAL